MRFLVAWEFGGGWGHIARLAPVARGLMARGHEVILAVRTPEQTAPRVPGATVLSLPVPELAPPNPLPVAASFADILHNVGWHSQPTLQQITSAWLALLDEVSPDVVVMDFSPGALLACQARPVGRVLLSTGFTSPPDVSPFPNLLPTPDPARSAESQVREAEILTRANRFLEGSGAARLDHLAQLFTRADLNILATWPELDHYGARRSANYAGVWTDTIMGDRPGWPHGHGPKVFVYSKEFPALGALFHLLGRSELPVLAYLSSGAAEARDRAIGDSIRIVDTPVDIQWAARECELAVLNAGHGASALMLMAGTPMLQIPLVLEQFHVARRVVEMGAGQLAIPSSPEQIAKGLQRLLVDSSYKRRAMAFRQGHKGMSQERRINGVVERICAVRKGPGSEDR